MSTLLSSFDARTGEVLAELPATTPGAVDAACDAAAAAFATWQGSDGATRARLLRGLAEALEGAREALVPLADRETALGPVRLNGELDRTAFQLRRFADLAERGEPFSFVDDPAVAGAPPAGHPAMQRWSSRCWRPRACRRAWSAWCRAAAGTLACVWCATPPSPRAPSPAPPRAAPRWPPRPPRGRAPSPSSAS